MDKCRTCGTTDNLKPNNAGQCYPCHRAEHVARMADRRKLWKKFILANINMVCENCGYDKCFASIDFHHIDPAKKKFAIGNWTNGRYAYTKKNRQLVSQEMNKCNILCANCHREFHHKEKEKKQSI